MKILTILGTRPEIIRLSLVIPLLDSVADHQVVHTGQNFDPSLSDLFFEELKVRRPDIHLDVRAASFAAQAGQILERVEAVIKEHAPDRVLILGDTNSGLSAIVARRSGIPVYHMEAGNRCFDDRVPEEVNRRLIDHSSSVLLPYTNRSRDNLLREGIPSTNVYVTGNPIKQVLDRFKSEIDRRPVLADMNLQAREYFLVTMHRSENVDVPSRLRGLVEALGMIAAEFRFPVVVSVHPRTRSKLKAGGIEPPAGVRFLEPMGFLDFVRLEGMAFCVLSDSGTVQEETCILGVPNVTIREVTERPETVECGSNMIAGTEPEAIMQAVRLVVSSPASWQPPAEYLTPNVAETVVRIVTSFRQPDPAEAEWQSRKGAEWK